MNENLNPIELSRDDFIRELAAAQSWGLMDYDGGGRQLLMVVTKGLPDQVFIGPNPVTMTSDELAAFHKDLEDAMTKRAAFDRTRDE